jgi:hypothetical protein
MNYPMVSQKCQNSFERIDKMSPELRSCVHEFGEPIVIACMMAGVKQPQRIRQLVREIWEGARQPTQSRPRLGSLDWIMQQAGAEISAETLIRILRDNHHYLVPLDPSKEMIEASMNTVSSYNMRITKRDKHRLRLRAAIEAGVKHLYPNLK